MCHEENLGLALAVKSKVRPTHLTYRCTGLRTRGQLIIWDGDSGGVIIILADCSPNAS